MNGSYTRVGKIMLCYNKTKYLLLNSHSQARGGNHTRIQQEIVFWARQSNSAWESHEGLPRGAVLEMSFKRKGKRSPNDKDLERIPVRRNPCAMAAGGLEKRVLLIPGGD